MRQDCSHRQMDPTSSNINNKYFKLTSTNYLDWKPQMKNLLTLLGYCHLITTTETEEENTLAAKLDPCRKEKALAILCLNCDIRLASQLSLECSDDLHLFCESIYKSISPKTIQNKTCYLSKILSYNLFTGKIEDNMKNIIDFTSTIFRLIDNSTTKTFFLIDWLISMWVIINLPPQLKVIS
ncbi:hypothetical protein O181_012568 [Austropuccinia psidii MF-1]|uniref:Uncharacterized protein n=1 Tax=Austropuccinia psidii MF-1 TaxID=1389203 RepID=A0A9Q3GMB5_9BASI|nr:hypothetical protein [Austropuccinia psidii MF-1]